MDGTRCPRSSARRRTTTGTSASPPSATGRTPWRGSTSNGRLERWHNNYARPDFDLGPTLGAWLDAPRTAGPAATRSRPTAQRSRRGGWATPSPIPTFTPSCRSADPLDRATLIRWGLVDFHHRFGARRAASGCPRPRSTTPTLGDVIDHGIDFTDPRAHQAARRPLAAAWNTHHSGARLDTSRPYWYRHPDGSGRGLDVFFYDGPLAQALAFGGALASTEAFVAESGGGGGAVDGGLVHLAVDGETFGHHRATASGCWRTRSSRSCRDAARASPTTLPTSSAIRRATKCRSISDRYGEGSAWSCATASGAGGATAAAGCGPRREQDVARAAAGRARPPAPARTRLLSRAGGAAAAPIPGRRATPGSKSILVPTPRRVTRLLGRYGEPDLGRRERAADRGLLATAAPPPGHGHELRLVLRRHRRPGVAARDTPRRPFLRSVGGPRRRGQPARPAPTCSTSWRQPAATLRRPAPAPMSSAATPARRRASGGPRAATGARCSGAAPLAAGRTPARPSGSTPLFSIRLPLGSRRGSWSAPRSSFACRPRHRHRPPGAVEIAAALGFCARRATARRSHGEYSDASRQRDRDEDEGDRTQEPATEEDRQSEPAVGRPPRAAGGPVADDRRVRLRSRPPCSISGVRPVARPDVRSRAGAVGRPSHACRLRRSSACAFGLRVPAKCSSAGRSSSSSVRGSFAARRAAPPARRADRLVWLVPQSADLSPAFDQRLSLRRRARPGAAGTIAAWCISSASVPRSRRSSSPPGSAPTPASRAAHGARDRRSSRPRPDRRPHAPRPRPARGPARGADGRCRRAVLGSEGRRRLRRSGRGARSAAAASPRALGGRTGRRRARPGRGDDPVDRDGPRRSRATNRRRRPRRIRYRLHAGSSADPVATALDTDR